MYTVIIRGVFMDRLKSGDYIGWWTKSKKNYELYARYNGNTKRIGYRYTT